MKKLALVQAAEAIRNAASTVPHEEIVRQAAA